MELAKARPPYIEFETRAVEKRKPAPPAGTGEVYWENIDFVIVTPQGTKDRIEKEVRDWFTALTDRVKMEMYPAEWLDKHQKAYDLWKQNREIPLDGTPIKGWPLASPAEAAKLLSVNIKTVEDLANANNEAIQRIGMGAQTLKSRAENFLNAKQDTGPLVSRLEAALTSLEVLTKSVATLTARNDALEAQLRSKMGERVQPLEPIAPGDLETRLEVARQSQGPDPLDTILAGAED